MEAAYIGVDAGGTKTALRLVSTGTGSVPDTRGPGVNLQRDGLDQSATVLADLLRPALDSLRTGELRAVCVGVSGAGRVSDQAALHDAIRSALEQPDLPLLVTHDAELALEAVFGPESGTVCIAGTGSVVYGRTRDGEILRSGGWGARFGDEGSGATIGRHAARAVACALDGGAKTALRALFSEHVGLDTADDLIRWTYREDGAFASLAPLVLAASDTDAVADRILREQSDLLIQDVRRLASRSAGALAPRLAFLGGLAGESVYRRYLNAALRRHLPRWEAVEATAEPVEGAVRRARRWADERAR